MTITGPVAPERDASHQGVSPQGSDRQETSQLGALIRRHRLRIGLTQRELADLSTISVRAIRDLEQGKARRPRTDTVRLIADALRLGPRARAALEGAAQQGRGGWGAVKSGFDAEPAAPPTALHPLVGREAETEVLVRELGSAAERLVNLVGLSGAGKTRLALEVAERLHGAGVPVLWYAFPGAVRDYLDPTGPELAALLGDCAEALFGPAGGAGAGGAAGRAVPYGGVGGPDGGAGGPDRGAGGERAGAAGSGGVCGLAELVGDRPVLLVLDGAPEHGPRFDRLTRLLRECPGLRLLVTAEQPWEVPGERTFVLGPLEVPAPDAAGEAVAAAAAVRVFLGHVRRVRPEFDAAGEDLLLAAEVCRRLDGHPMALGAAASWLAVCDLRTLRDCLEGDPAPFLDHLAGGDGGRRFRDALHRRLLRLPAGHRSLLAALRAVPEGDFGLPDIVRLTGAGLADCGRMVRDLLVCGALRSTHETGRSVFRVPHLVRAFHPDAAPGTLPAAAAGVPA
ncbi:helix-turn-helix domain-containing protein [Streptomyces sp. NPDC101132]|uniref:helix-turn-helix domain-containing protein n=1 Tax=Streptomyces sp. NPDC101132 TaxID=3366110 RepID=UPI003807A1E6